ncbi:hypothetical protein KBY97_14220 [Synechococcus sp. ATX 2A4]|uniref:type II toxin-antitoxin system VapC family toxin n=1 Tax=Synechococcus sp. ATX 2A4 TaxID=2823727 RepID=UPI0020CB7509|nr:PIN domain-containing protein [Synechococcus sp. ATX 2A4]MCP9886267.1 hypothetical protein [Synechococcus sp. ATX 2A4]
MAAQGGYLLDTSVLPLSPQVLVTAAQQAGFALLAITPDHAAATALLPPHHKDLLDRLLIAQARSAGVLLLSTDRALKRYGPTVMLLGERTSP